MFTVPSRLSHRPATVCVVAEHPTWRWEGDTYIRPAGRGVTLVAEDGHGDLDAAIERFFEDATGRVVSGDHARMRITVELVEDLGSGKSPSAPGEPHGDARRRRRHIRGRR